MARQLLEYHPATAFRFIPGLRARVEHESGGYLVRVNAQGFRCNHNFLPEKTTERRVLLFGDSFTAGDGVSNEKRYGDVLEGLLPGLQVYNFGLPGSGTDQQYLAYREFAQGIDHDVVIIAVLVENIRRIVSRYRLYHDDQGRQVYFAKPYFELEDGRLALRQAPPAKAPLSEEELPEDGSRFVDQGGRFAVLRRLVAGAGLRDLAQRVIRYQPLPEYDDAGHPAWQLMQAILREWIGGCRSPVLLMPIPLYQYLEGTADGASYQARFRELTASVGCRLHDPLPDLLAYSPAERRSLRFEQDVHLTPRGHEALARSLAPALASLLGSLGSSSSASDVRS